MMDLYFKINKPFDEEYLTPTWKELKLKLEEMFANGIPENFLETPLIQQIMTATNAPYIKDEREYLKSRVIHNDTLDDTGIHHLYHFKKYQEMTGINFSTIGGSVIEWGGGYGNACELFKQFYNDKCTYVIIDIPIMSYLQYFYLKKMWDVNMITETNVHISRYKINLVPLPFLDKVRLKCKLFLSTWAISESGKKSIEFVLNNNLFNAEHLLLGYETTRENQFPYQKEFIEKIKKETDKILNIDIISPYQFYLFR